jgi:hypothetical protein
MPPELVVFVDSHALATDFWASRELYLARLANVGFQVSGIRFQLGQTRAHAPAAVDARPPVRPLSATEEQEVQDLTRGLPDGLREKAQAAIRAAKQRKEDTSAT